MIHEICNRVTLFTFPALLTLAMLTMYPGDVYAQEDTDAALSLQFNLEQCLDKALHDNRRRPVSRYKVAMAEAQHRQALSGYWPQIQAQGGYKRTDEPMNFLYPSTVMNLPMLGMSFPVPEQEIKLMDEDTFQVSLDAEWLLYDGGMRQGYREQASGKIDMMKQESRRTDLEIVDSVRRLYWGAVMAGQLHIVGQHTLERMETTLNLTETMYKEGSGKVKKTDWLSNKVMVETLRSMVALLEKNEKMAGAALANTIGMSWDSTVIPIDTVMPFSPFKEKLNQIVSNAYGFNPDWASIEAGLRAAEGGMRTAKSGHYPKVAVTGKLYKWWNEYDGGLATDENTEGWNIGLGVSFPLFSGHLTQAKIAEARAQIAKIKEEKVLFKDGLGLQVRDVVLSLDAAEKSHNASQEALNAAEENRSLNTRAYQHGLVETEDVVSAQLMEAMMSAQYYKARYEHVALKSQLELLVGNQILKNIQ